MSWDDAVELGLSADTPLRELVVEPIHHLDINNIRVIQKIESALRMIYPLIKDSSEKVKRQAAISISVFASSLYERGRGFPSPEQILKYNTFTHRMLARKTSPQRAMRSGCHVCNFAGSRTAMTLTKRFWMRCSAGTLRVRIFAHTPRLSTLSPIGTGWMRSSPLSGGSSTIGLI